VILLTQVGAPDGSGAAIVDIKDWQFGGP